MRYIKPVWMGVLLAAQLVACDRPSTVTPPTERSAGEVSVVARAQASAPLMVTIEPTGATVESDLTAVSNDTSVTYTWSLNGRTLDGGFGRVLPKAMFRRSDTLAVEVALNGQQARGETTIQDSPPRAVEVSLDRPLDSLHQGIDLKAIPKGVDPDGDDIQWEYQWIRNNEVLAGETSQILRGDRYQRGDRVTVKVTPSDGTLRGEPYTPLAVTVPNGAPGFVSRPPGLKNSAEYLYQIQATDPDGDRIQYRLVKAPSGMTVDSETGTIHWPLKGTAPGRHAVEIEIADGFGGTASQTFELDVAPPEG